MKPFLAKRPPPFRLVFAKSKAILHIQRSQDIASDCADGQGFALKQVQDEKKESSHCEALDPESSPE